MRSRRSNMLKRQYCTFKINNFNRKDHKPVERNWEFRLSLEEFLKILAHMSFQTSIAFSTLNWSRVLESFVTLSEQFFRCQSGQSRWCIKATDRDFELTTINNSIGKERHCLQAMSIICGRTSRMNSSRRTFRKLRQIWFLYIMRSPCT